MELTLRFIQGIFPFEGKGLHEPVKLGTAARYSTIEPALGG